MAEKRFEHRRKKRLTVKFGPSDLQFLGFTVDVSVEGLFIESNTVFRPGTLLRVQLNTRDGQTILLDGEVRWGKKYPAYAHKLRSGMGLLVKTFHEGQDLFEELYND